MKRTGLPSAAVGALLAVVVVAVAGVALYLGSTLTPSRSAKPAPDSRVALIVVAPDAHGVTLPITIATYPLLASGPASESVDPSERAVVSGTSARSLGAAYPFGGGKAIAEAYGAARAVAAPHWIVIEARLLERFAPAGPVTVSLPRPVDVFDGTQLYSFPAGTARIPGDELGLLMDGVSRWTTGERAGVRRQLELEALKRVTSASVGMESLRTDLPEDQLTAWRERMRTEIASGK